MDYLQILKQNIIISNQQGYALYFYYDGKEYSETNGLLTINKNKKIGFDSNFRLASVSKQFIAFSIVNLVNEGLLSYNTNIKEIYDDLPNYFTKITIKNLLNHTSGILDYEDMDHDENIQLKDIDIIDFLKSTNNTYFIPGTTYKYSNTGYILLGLIVEKVSNYKINDYIESFVFKKANMINSKVNIQGITEIKERVYGHIIEDNKLVEMDQYWCSATIGDGGLYSNINDLKKWCKYLVSTKNYFEMKKPNYINDESYNEYGYGLRIIKVDNDEIIYHCGSTIGTNTLLLFSEDLNICLIFLTNLNNIDTAIMKDNLINNILLKK